MGIRDTYDFQKIHARSSLPRYTLKQMTLKNIKGRRAFALIVSIYSLKMNKANYYYK